MLTPGIQCDMLHTRTHTTQPKQLFFLSPKPAISKMLHKSWRAGYVTAIMLDEFNKISFLIYDCNFIQHDENI